MSWRVLIQIVTYNSCSTIEHCLQSLQKLEGFTLGENLSVRISDNNSVDGTQSILQGFSQPGVTLDLKADNTGFCYPNNQAAWICVTEKFDALLLLNPDAALTPGCLLALVAELQAASQVGACTPLLLQADTTLTALEPPIIDSAGMCLEPSLRHFDRLQGHCLSHSDVRSGEVFGATGACVLLRTRCISDVAFWGPAHEHAVEALYPFLAEGRESRLQLFDEAFFAYREDADLAWRMQALGWKTLLVAYARAAHVRRVRPADRAELPAAINALGVRNRFLLQFNNFSLVKFPEAILPGILWRNLMVLLGVFFVERSSIQSIRDAIVLRRRARERFSIIRARKPTTTPFLWFREKLIPSGSGI